jgi:Protein of unknown function (DUF2786)
LGYAVAGACTNAIKGCGWLTMIDISKIVDRVRKLLALANNNANEKEAASAAARATALLAEHNLTMAQVESAGDDARISNEFETRNWSREMCHALAKLNFCKSWYECERRGYDSVTILGTQANVATTAVMLDYLVQTAVRLAKEQCATELDRQHFRKGFSARIAERLDELREQRAQSATQTGSGSGNTLPALASLYAQHALANEALFEKLHPKVRLTYGRSLGGGGTGYSAGYKAGGTVSLDPQMARSSRKALR